MNRKKLLLALLAGLACAPSAQAMDMNGEQKSLATRAGETVGELGSTAHSQARNIYAAIAPDAAEWRAYLWPHDPDELQHNLGGWKEEIRKLEVKRRVATEKYEEAKAQYDSVVESASQFLPQDSFVSGAIGGKSLGIGDSEKKAMDEAQAVLDKIDHSLRTTNSEIESLNRKLKFAKNTTLRQQAAGLYDQKIQAPAFTPRNVFEGTQAVATAAATSVKCQAMGLPETFKGEFVHTQRYVESFIPSTEDERTPAGPLKNNGYENLIQTPLPIAGAWVSTIVLDRALAVLGKAFPKLFGTGDELRKNKVLALMLAGTGVYGSRMSQDDPYAAAQGSTAKTRHEKALLVSVLMAAGTLFANSMRRWLGERKTGEAMPTWMQEVKHALKVLILHYWNIRAAASLRDMGSDEDKDEY